MWIWRGLFDRGPSTHPTPYFHDAGANPGFRSNSSRIVPASQFIVREGIGAQKPPIVAIGSRHAVQQGKILFQAVWTPTKPEQAKWAIGLFEHKGVTWKFLHMLVDQCQGSRPIAIDGSGERIDVLSLAPGHAIQAGECLRLACLRRRNIPFVLPSPRQSHMGQGKIRIGGNGRFQARL